VFVFGDLGKGVSKAYSDMDFLIVTARERVYFCIFFLAIFKRMKWLNHRKLPCFNYLISEAFLEIPEKNIFTVKPGNAMFKKLELYFLSGTGNSFRAATWLQKIAEQNGCATELTAIGTNTAPPRCDRDSLFALFFPTHGFTAPWKVIQFAGQLPRVKKVPAVVVATRASMRFGRILTPGVSGSATFLIALILWLKGFRVHGGLSLDMPSNWQALHPGMSAESYAWITQRAEPRLAVFAGKIFSGGRSWFNFNNLYEIFWTIALSWLSLLYLLLGRFFLAKILFANSNCNLCGVCVTHCPVGAIKIVGRRRPHLYWRHSCESCMRCLAFCPRQAIEAGHSWAVILYLLISASGLTFLMNRIGFFVLAQNQNFLPTWGIFLVNFYLSLFFGYYLFNFLIQFSLVNQIFSRTTFTQFYRRSHQSNVKLSDLIDPERQKIIKPIQRIEK
jgi:ferredoxin